MSPVFYTRHQLLLGCFVAPELIRDHHTWDVLTALRPEGTRLAEKLLGSNLVSSALDEDIQYVAILIDCPPQILRLTVDLQKHFVQKPLVSRSCSSTSEFIGVGLAELPRPLAHRFVGHDNATFREQLFHVTVAQGEAKVEPDGVADDLFRKAVAFVGCSSRCVHAASIAWNSPISARCSIT